MSFDDFSLITGPKTTNFIYLERRSYGLLKYIKMVIVDQEVTTLCSKDLLLAANVGCSYLIKLRCGV